MSTLSEEQARAYMHKLLGAMSQAGGSDLFIANDFPPSMKANGSMQPLTNQKLNGEMTRVFAESLMNEKQRNGESTDWYNFWFHRDSSQFIEKWQGFPSDFDNKGKFRGA